MVQLESVIYYVVSKVKYNNVITLRKIDRSIVVLVLSPLSCSFLNFQIVHTKNTRNELARLVMGTIFLVTYYMLTVYFP